MGRFDEAPAGSTAGKIGEHLWETFGPPDGHLVLETSGPLRSYLHRALEYIARADE
jgi:hypothetical protein